MISYESANPVQVLYIRSITIDSNTLDVLYKVSYDYQEGWLGGSIEILDLRDKSFCVKFPLDRKVTEEEVLEKVEAILLAINI